MQNDIAKAVAHRNNGSSCNQGVFVGDADADAGAYANPHHDKVKVFAACKYLHLMAIRRETCIAKCS